MNTAKPLGPTNNGRAATRKSERIHNELAPTDLYSSLRTCPDLSPLSTAMMQIHLVPCESQPLSCSRIWTVKTRKRYLPFSPGRKCKINQQRRDKTDVPPFHGEFFQTKDWIKITGTAKDGALEGEDFELVLSSCLKPNEAFYGDRRLAMAGFLQRGVRCREAEFSVTHDAFVYRKNSGPVRQGPSRECSACFDLV